MTKKFTPKTEFEKLTKQEEKIIQLLHAEQRRTKEKFPLPFALIATFGLVATISGFSKWIEHVPFLEENPLVIIIIGVCILIATGTAYRKIN